MNVNFKEDKAIYLQIAERICDLILLGEYKEGERIPSVRTYADTLKVNYNTVMRSFNNLYALGIIFKKRGIGYFIEVGACEKIHSMRRKTQNRHCL